MNKDFLVTKRKGIEPYSYTWYPVYTHANIGYIGAKLGQRYDGHVKKQKHAQRFALKNSTK